MSKVVMLWLDGFSSRYLDPQKTPFLFELSRSGFSTTVEPLFAFAGIGATVFTGTRINTHRIWCDWVLRRGRTSPVVFKFLLRLCDWLPDDIMNQYARYAVYRLFSLNPGTPNLIPVEFTDFFGTKQQTRLTDNEPIERAVTLFDQLRKCEVMFSLDAFHESIYEGRIISRIRNALADGNRFVLLRLASLDRLGHKHGPESREVVNRIGEIDEAVRRLVEKGIASDPSVHVVIFSEHGMVPVKEHIDLLALLRELPLRVGGNYVLFLNSTVACFWPSNDVARNLITEELGRIEHGTILDKPRLKELGIDKIGAEYGDMLFALKEGSVFFPDFYRRRTPPKGMHGYAFATYDKPVLIVHSPGVSYVSRPIASARFIDVMPTVLDLLRVPVPSTCEGASLLRQ